MGGTGPRRNRTRRPEAGQTPYEAAISCIQQLDSYDLSDLEAVNPFYVGLSAVLRVYLVREPGVAALERTTREVVEVLPHRPDGPTEVSAPVRAVLELADLVMFADVRSTSDDHEKAVREARSAPNTIEAGPRSLEPETIDDVASSA